MGRTIAFVFIFISPFVLHGTGIFRHFWQSFALRGKRRDYDPVRADGLPLWYWYNPGTAPYYTWHESSLKSFRDERGGKFFGRWPDGDAHAYHQIDPDEIVCDYLEILENNKHVHLY